MAYKKRLRLQDHHQLTRPVKFLINSPEFRKLYDHTRKIYNCISDEVHSRGSNSHLLNLSGTDSYNYALHCNKLEHESYDAAFARIFERYGIFRSTAKRGTLSFILQNYHGYMSRGYRTKLGKTPLSFKNKSAVRFCDTEAKLSKDKSKVMLRFPFVDEYFHFDVNIINKNAAHLLNLVTIGANLRPVKGDKFLATFAVKLPFIHSYEPETFLGFDINQFDENFVYCSDGDVFTLPGHVKGLLHNAKREWEEINNKDLQSSVRSLHRRRWINLRKEMRKFLRVLADQVNAKAHAKKAVVCVDDVHVTGNYGFGNDLLIQELVKVFEANGTPHILVHPSHTSCQCYECGSKSSSNRPSRADKSDDYFCCVKCGHSNAVADHHAAINVLLKGKGMAVKKNEEWEGLTNLISEVVEYNAPLF